MSVTVVRFHASKMICSRDGKKYKKSSMKYYGWERAALTRTGSVKCSRNLSKLMTRLENEVLIGIGRITLGIIEDRFIL